MKSDKEVFDEYCREMKMSPFDPVLERSMIKMIRRIREDEPRINSGIHLIDYLSISDDDDTMDTFYGPDYWEQS